MPNPETANRPLEAKVTGGTDELVFTQTDIQIPPAELVNVSALKTDGNNLEPMCR